MLITEDTNYVSTLSQEINPAAKIKLVKSVSELVAVTCIYVASFSYSLNGKVTDVANTNQGNFYYYVICIF
jgi:hypothetical protein